MGNISRPNGIALKIDNHEWWDRKWCTVLLTPRPIDLACLSIGDGADRVEMDFKKLDSMCCLLEALDHTGALVES